MSAGTSSKLLPRHFAAHLIVARVVGVHPVFSKKIVRIRMHLAHEKVLLTDLVHAAYLHPA